MEKCLSSKCNIAVVKKKNKNYCSNIFSTRTSTKYGLDANFFVSLLTLHCMQNSIDVFKIQSTFMSSSSKFIQHCTRKSITFYVITTRRIWFVSFGFYVINYNCHFFEESFSKYNSMCGSNQLTRNRQITNNNDSKKKFFSMQNRKLWIESYYCY